MNSERILYALGGVDPAFVEEASPERRTLEESERRIRRAAVRWGAALACATALILVAVFVDWREMLWPRPVTPSATTPSASTSSGTSSGAVMNSTQVRIDRWLPDGFAGTVAAPGGYGPGVPFQTGDPVTVVFRPNETEIRREDGSLFFYGIDSENPADCGWQVGVVVEIGFGYYESTPDGGTEYRIHAYVVHPPYASAANLEDAP